MQYRLEDYTRTFELDLEKVKSKLGVKRMRKIEEVSLEGDCVFIYLHEQFKDSDGGTCSGFEPSGYQTQKGLFDDIKEWVDGSRLMESDSGKIL